MGPIQLILAAVFGPQAAQNSEEAEDLQHNLPSPHLCLWDHAQPWIAEDT